MILRGPGEFNLVKVEGEDHFEGWASASSSAPATVQVFKNDMEEDFCYLWGPTHTWWVSNPMFKPELQIGDRVKIILGGHACALRIQYPGLKLVE